MTVSPPSIRSSTVQLTPLRSKGWHYTWCNKQDTGSRVYNKIDWALGDFLWLQQSGQQQNLHPKPFRFFPNVMEHPNFSNILKQVWTTDESDHPMENAWCKLKKLKLQIKDINRYMASYQQKLGLAREELAIIQDQLQNQMLNQELFNKEKKLVLEIAKWSNITEQALRHKARATWVESGDGNSKYFHA
ncbi:hypothetical protein RDI58_026666 [Solanum bulbocastanum]|uniref:Uncharacterized protein n=1 Tax=Solanum bulbocastanum TaxID=147425 RepID=A0AAN8SVS4_SOLBU